MNRVLLTGVLRGKKSVSEKMTVATIEITERYYDKEESGDRTRTLQVPVGFTGKLIGQLPREIGARVEIEARLTVTTTERGSTFLNCLANVIIVG